MPDIDAKAETSVDIIVGISVGLLDAVKDWSIDGTIDEMHRYTEETYHGRLESNGNVDDLFDGTMNGGVDGL